VIRLGRRQQLLSRWEVWRTLEWNDRKETAGKATYARMDSLGTWVGAIGKKAERKKEHEYEQQLNKDTPKSKAQTRIIDDAGEPRKGFARNMHLLESSYPGKGWRRVGVGERANIWYRKQQERKKEKKKIKDIVSKNRASLYQRLAVCDMRDMLCGC